jgi:hypothetical protein
MARRLGRLEEAAQPLSAQSSFTGELRFRRQQGEDETTFESQIMEAIDLARAFVQAGKRADSSLPRSIAELDTPTLRKLRQAMVTLAGHRASAIEPPKPPPVSIEDLAL